MIRLAKKEDAKNIASIYNYYIINTTYTFEVEEINEAPILMKMQSFPLYLVYEINNEIIGYAYICPWKARHAYKNSVESTIYLKNEKLGYGYGTALYRYLLEESFAMGYHCIIGGVTLPNDASVRLHEKLGFQPIGIFREVGYKFDQWLDVGYWQVLKK